MTSGQIASPGPATAPRTAARRGPRNGCRSKPAVSGRRGPWGRSHPRSDEPGPLFAATLSRLRPGLQTAALGRRRRAGRLPAPGARRATGVRARVSGLAADGARVARRVAHPSGRRRRGAAGAELAVGVDRDGRRARGDADQLHRGAAHPADLPLDAQGRGAYRRPGGGDVLRDSHRPRVPAGIAGAAQLHAGATHGAPQGAVRAPPRAGAVVVLVGRSGAGKTTVTDLVARFHDPTRGRILLNGSDVRDFRLRTYRDLLAIVQQDVFLFDGSVRENIAYGRRETTDAEIEDAARRANAHEFIVKLPEQYETSIGERGVKLSGGQQQRLAIARAILASPQILILDEATSNLDTESEQLIQASMATLLAGRTTFVIAHRLSTIRRADMILLMDDGRVTERGTHEELMAARGAYHGMVLRQVEVDDLLRRHPAL